MKLFMKPGSCSLSPHLVLEESGLSYATEAVDLQTKITASGQDYWAINPKGYVPALLLDSGELLTEGPAIVEYLADQVPEKKLVPANGSVARYHLRGWLNFIATELHKAIVPLISPVASDEFKNGVLANLERRFAYVDQQLAGRPFLMGEDFSVADAYLFTVLSWSKYIALDFSRWPQLLAFKERVAARPAVRAVLAAEGLA